MNSIYGKTVTGERHKVQIKAYKLIVDTLKIQFLCFESFILMK